MKSYLKLRNVTSSPVEIEAVLLFSECIFKYEQSKSTPSFLQSIVEDEQKASEYIEEFLTTISWDYNLPFSEDLFIEGLKLASEKQMKMEKQMTIHQFYEMKEKIYDENFAINYPYGIVPNFIYSFLIQLVKDGSKKDILNVYAENNLVLHLKENESNFINGYFEIPNHKMAFNFYLLNFLYELKHNEFRISDSLLNPGFTNGDTLQQFDAVISAPPFDPIYNEDFIKEDTFGRFANLKLSKRDSASALMLHAVAHLNENGKAAMLLHGSPLFQTGRRGSARKFLLENDYVEGVIALSTGLLRGSSIPTYVLIMNKNKPNELKKKVVFFDARDCFEKKQKHKYLSETNVRELIDEYYGEKDSESMNVVSVEQILQNEGILDPLHYAVKKEIYIDGYGIGKINEEKYKSIPMVPLEEYCDVITGINVKKSEAGETIKVLSGKALQNEKIVWSEIEEVPVEKKGSLARSKVLPNDILMLSRGAAAKFAIADEDFADEEVFASTNLFILRPKNDASPAYILAYLSSPFGLLELEKIKKGTTIPMYTAKDVKQLPIPKVDLHIQQKIQQEFLKSIQQYEEAIAQANEEFNQSKIDIYKKMGLMGAIN